MNKNVEQIALKSNKTQLYIVPLVFEINVFFSICAYLLIDDICSFFFLQSSGPPENASHQHAEPLVCI